jgi:hypothetical protein
MKHYLDGKHSVFISYAHADNIGQYGWVTDFVQAVDEIAPCRLQEIKWLQTSQSEQNPAMSGVLDDELKARIRDSFCMAIIVAGNYPLSKWCFKELEYFREIFGEKGFHDRLYVIAMSESSIKELKKRPEWNRLLPLEGQVWIPFYQETQRDTPIPVWSSRRREAEFILKFDRFCNDLVRKIRSDVESAATGTFDPALTVHEHEQTFAKPASALAPPQSRNSALIYIESNVKEVDHWETIGAQIRTRWNLIVQGEHLIPPLYLVPHALPIDHIDSHPDLGDADGVVLLWGQKSGDALVAQINKVEGKLWGGDPAPGIVAYLTPPQARSEAKLPAWGWKVLRFNAPAPDDIDVDPAEADDLQKFLTRILKRIKQRADRSTDVMTYPAP